MFEKSVIYLLFTAVFGAASIQPNYNTDRVRVEATGTQEIVETGVRKVKNAFETFSFEPAKDLLYESGFLETNAEPDSTSNLPTQNK